MNVSPLTNAFHAASAASRETADGSATQAATTSPASASVDQNQFLTLLVAQLKNQDPMNPTDSSQFMGELAQFSTLQEVIGMHQDLNALVAESGGVAPQI